MIGFESGLENAIFIFFAVCTFVVLWGVIAELKLQARQRRLSERMRRFQ